MRTPDGQELPPSNRGTNVRACQVVEVEDGKIKAVRHCFDMATIFQQLGLMEAAGAAA